MLFGQGRETERKREREKKTNKQSQCSMLLPATRLANCFVDQEKERETNEAQIY